MARLSRHRAVVTGAGAGIGKAIALRLAEEGARVVVNDLDPAAANMTLEAIRASGGEALAAPGDVADADAVDRMFGVCEEAWGSASLVVNNAGIVQQVPLKDLAVDDFDRMIAVHLRGCFLGCRRAINPMLEAGAGVIVNVASQLGQIGGVELTHYSAAKAGIIGLTKALAREVSAAGVRVNAVAPGPIATELVMRLSPDWRAAKAKELPLGRFGEPEDVAATVAFLASDEAKIYVGQTLGPNSGDVML
ncbi:3-oxoacyl-ACP reductase FabG [Jiella sp. MQZ9-1]|uniref:3-oxoacyl-ACP reductase FabG n=1 Tax=Jiella flava TaxID=2816857 RepID=A0A939JWB9_9HYPH|nr:3-oxoacyl-ACP reductase FabG [Jiella flava]MBO0662887.1 3-oxoacyl-ACP reductase FabG [Jiella flava]MCD2471353.1 3-oxoacyl-ACP reductase FabG [Jiella flava]